MTPIQVIGIGLEGADGLTKKVQQIVESATVLVGSSRHLAYFPSHLAKRLFLGDLNSAIVEINRYLEQNEKIVILVSGDPLFFGLGRLLLTSFSSEQLNFHSHLSSVQLAFSRIKIPWQDAKIISAHGRSLDELTQVLQKGFGKIAVLTDTINTPSAIAHLYLALDIPVSYKFWVCENLGGSQENVREYASEALLEKEFSPLNIVVLIAQENLQNIALELQNLPLFGLPDRTFLSFRDRPGLMTKREVRIAILGELALQPKQMVWDIGAGTGSVSIEIARLCPTSQVYAVEKTAMGITLIEKNCTRLQVQNVIPIQGKAPDVLTQIPNPDRIFIGGTGGNLTEILQYCQEKLTEKGIVVMAFATLEHFHKSLDWFNHSNWNYRLLQLQFSRSVPVGQFTRFNPLNPVTILTASPSKFAFFQ